MCLPSVCNALAQDVSLVGHTVSWNLPVSKTDPAAVGAVRSHACACGNMSGAPPGALASHMCPACTLWTQRNRALQAHGPSAPLFYSESGTFATKVGFIETIASVAELVGSPRLLPSGVFT